MSKDRATMMDDRRRVVLPNMWPANSSVSIQVLDEDTIVIKRLKPSKFITIVLAAPTDVKPDPEWEKFELAMVRSAGKLEEPE